MKPPKRRASAPTRRGATPSRRQRPQVVVTEAELRSLGALNPECEALAQLVREGLALLRKQKGGS